jgi:hypothetical protein
MSDAPDVLYHPRVLYRVMTKHRHRPMPLPGDLPFGIVYADDVGMNAPNGGIKRKREDDADVDDADVNDADVDDADVDDADVDDDMAVAVDVTTMDEMIWQSGLESVEVSVETLADAVSHLFASSELIYSRGVTYLANVEQTIMRLQIASSPQNCAPIGTPTLHDEMQRRITEAPTLDDVRVPEYAQHDAIIMQTIVVRHQRRGLGTAAVRALVAAAQLQTPPHCVQLQSARSAGGRALVRSMNLPNLMGDSTYCLCGRQ